MSSNNHQTGAEKQKSSTNFRGERDQSELPWRADTRASTRRMYPSQSGKNSHEVRALGSIQLNSQQTASRSSPTQPRAGQTRISRIIYFSTIHGAWTDAVICTGGGDGKARQGQLNKLGEACQDVAGAHYPPLAGDQRMRYADAAQGIF